MACRVLVRIADTPITGWSNYFHGTGHRGSLTLRWNSLRPSPEGERDEHPTFPFEIEAAR